MWAGGGRCRGGATDIKMVLQNRGASRCRTHENGGSVGADPVLAD